MIISYIFSINKKNYLLLGTTTFVYYDNNNQIRKVQYVDKINKKYDYEKFNVYLNNKFNEYYINFYDEDNTTFYNLYDKKNKKISSNDLLLAYKGNINIKVNPAKIETDFSKEEKNKMLQI